ncbi:hypothetical protein [Aureibacter tunicatorum]|uniref:Uncharacterized protein n=1 Tax=Aureibacter tunicatorum TaxID=866807 RepID=A0AAE4BRU7_9BACT|nr:hypothetical protein [Aureibacter tunicatorum]MDR6238258.1 hypothetical protein [Aureibacter tunicatorum]BDD03291.1 hypothetical protein AUTU_07740 [Aureibacter tunicatorum]
MYERFQISSISKKKRFAGGEGLYKMPPVYEQPIQALMKERDLLGMVDVQGGDALDLEAVMKPVYDLVAMIKAYHETPRSEEIYRRFEMLDSMEHYIYSWHSSNPIHEEKPLPHHTRLMMRLLDDVQIEHEMLVSELLKQGKAPWLPEAKQKMSSVKSSKLQEYWAQLVGGAANIELAPMVEHDKLMQGQGALEKWVKKKFSKSKQWPEELFVKFMALNAKLLTTPYGRLIFENLFENKKGGLIVRPFHVPDENIGSIVAWPHGIIDRKKAAVNIPSQWKDTDISVYDETADVLVNEKPYTREEVHRVPEAGLKRDAASMEMGDMDKIDEEDLWMEVSCRPETKQSPKFKKGNEVLFPRFIEYGSALAQAMNFVNMKDQAIKLEIQQEYKVNPELKPWRSSRQHYAVTQIENQLREEHGLPLRKYMHSNTRPLWK